MNYGKFFRDFILRNFLTLSGKVRKKAQKRIVMLTAFSYKLKDFSKILPRSNHIPFMYSIFLQVHTALTKANVILLSGKYTRGTYKRLGSNQKRISFRIWSKLNIYEPCH